jgi:hypothetical protein
MIDILIPATERDRTELICRICLRKAFASQSWPKRRIRLGGTIGEKGTEKWRRLGNSSVIVKGHNNGAIFVTVGKAGWLLRSNERHDTPHPCDPVGGDAIGKHCSSQWYLPLSR